MGKFHSSVGIGSVLLKEVVVSIGDSASPSDPAYFYISPDEARGLADSLNAMARTVEMAHAASTCINCGDM